MQIDLVHWSGCFGPSTEDGPAFSRVSARGLWVQKWSLHPPVAASFLLVILQPQYRFLAHLPSVPHFPWPLFKMYFGGRFHCFLSGVLFPHLQSRRTAISGPSSPNEFDAGQDDFATLIICSLAKAYEVELKYKGGKIHLLTHLLPSEHLELSG